jgi:HK97 family phage major capsid protein
MATPEVSLAELKASIDQEMRAFDELKKTNDARIAALEKRGHADPLFDEKLEKIQDVMNDQEKILRDFKRQQEAAELRRQAAEEQEKLKNEEWLKKVEAKVNRSLLGLGGAGGSALDERTDEILGRKAFVKFLRKGQLSPEEHKVLSSADDTTGGFLSPGTFSANIIRAEVLFSPVRGLVTVVQIGTGEYSQPKRTATAAATRVAEQGTRSETTNPAWGLIKINAPEMYAEARITTANLEDAAFDLEGILASEFGEQFGVKEGAEVINGTGGSSMLGILDANAAGISVPIAYTPSGSASTIAGASGAQGDGLINLYHALKTAYAKNATWILNRASLGKVRLLKDTTGQYLWQPGVGQSGTLNAGMAPTILSAPYVECPDMPDEGSNTFPIAFGDFKRAYIMVERVDMVITRDPFTLAASGQVKFFARRRVGGQVVLGEAIRLYKCATS